MNVCVVLSTAPDAATGRRIGRELVRRKLAACVTLVPAARSIYRWKGRIESARETLVIAKTTRRLLPRTRRAVLEMHPYEVPEFLVVPVSGGSREYLGWVEASLR